ncbi:type II toxin-antitoxin system RelE family toxin [Demequina sp.]|uniref:type II toxin-antitoxin system RelE family toxin n=1 Tax=Demequina sp. TaxID=2050685 RepID=UPI003D120D1F
MAYSVAITKDARRQLSKLDPAAARRVLDYLEAAAELDDPRLRGKGLTGDRGGLWRYRIGDYRVICEILDAEMVILALEVGHRGSVHRG